MKGFIYYKDNWPNFEWDTEKLLPILEEVHQRQGKLSGKMDILGFRLRDEAYLQTLSQDVLKTSEIEDEILDGNQVRSSIADQLGMEIENKVDSSRDVDGIVNMMLDATTNFKIELTKERLFEWHASLFPTPRSSKSKIIIGNWRDDSTGPMQVVSGAMGKEKVHFQAPAANVVDKEMAIFTSWFNNFTQIDKVIKAGVAHLWFLTIHPFEDGNGRIARAITDMTLSRSENSARRFYSMSLQIQKERKAYYEMLEKVQQGSLDITKWLIWFLNCIKCSIDSSELIINRVLVKHNFWQVHKSKPLNDRQLKMINKLLDGFIGKLTSSKWAKINKCSSDTALRDIQKLIEKDILKKEAAGGRSTNYELIIPKI